MLTAVAAAVLVIVHLFSARMRFLRGVPRSRWLSAFGGVSVAYVFVHLLPELAEGQEAIQEQTAESPAGEALGYFEHHVYLVALLGLAVFYGVERHSLESRREHRTRSGEDRTTDDAFWLSIGSFSAYNLIIGYLLMRGELEPVWQLVLYTFALALHFVINDFGLREHHKDAYDRIGRWVVSGAVVVGWVLGVLTEVPEAAIAVVLAFVGGGVVLNVLKEELPGERTARFLPFVGGAVFYTVVLQLL